MPEDDLEDVALADVGFGLFDHRVVLFARGVAGHGGVLGGFNTRDATQRQGLGVLLDLLGQRIEGFEGLGVDGQWIVVGADEGELDEVDELVDMIEDDEFVVEPEGQIGQVAIVGRGVFEAEFGRLGVADRIVPGVAEPSAQDAFGQEAAIGGGPGGGQVPIFTHRAEGFERVGGCDDAFFGGMGTMIGDGDRIGFGSEFDCGVGTEDGVSALLVAAFD